MKKLLSYIFTIMLATSAQAMNVQNIQTSEGIGAYFVESSTLPMVSLQVMFRAGSAFEPQGKEGISGITAALIGQGTKTLDSEAFQQEMQDIGARLSVGSDGLNLKVTLLTLSKYKEDAFKLFKEALLSPRFDNADFERIQKASVASLERSKQKPSSVVKSAFARTYYGDHPYGREATVASVKALTLQDVRAYYAKHIHKANMVVSAVGDINKHELSNVLDMMLKDLPTGQLRNQIKTNPPVPSAQLVRVERDIPQTHVIMAHKGIDRHDPDYFAAYAMNYILGGGGFNSRLMEEVREKRGLAYSVYSYFEPMPLYGRFVAAVQTKNADADTSIALMKKEIRRMKNGDVSAEEVMNAKRYLMGSFPLRIDSNSKILGYLSVMQMEDLGVDYLDTWTSKIETLTLADIKRAAARLLRPDDLVIVTVGGAS